MPHNTRLVAKLESVVLPQGCNLLTLLGAESDDASVASLNWLTERRGTRGAASMLAHSRAD